MAQLKCYDKFIEYVCTCYKMFCLLFSTELIVFLLFLNSHHAYSSSCSRAVLFDLPEQDKFRTV